MRAKEDPHPRPTFPVVRIRQYRMEPGNHFSNSTVDVGEVVTTLMPRCVNRVDRGWREARRINK